MIRRILLVVVALVATISTQLLVGCDYENSESNKKLKDPNAEEVERLKAPNTLRQEEQLVPDE